MFLEAPLKNCVIIYTIMNVIKNIIKSDKITWTDILYPTEEELKNIGEKFNIHPIIVEELKNPSNRSHIELYDNYLFLVYHFPIYNQLEQISERSEIDFIICNNEIITVRYEESEPVEEFKKALADSNFKSKAMSLPYLFVYEFIEKILAYNQRQLNHIQEKAEKIASELFCGKEKEILKEISYLKRDLSEYRIIIRPQEYLFKSLIDNGISFWGDSCHIYLNDLLGDYLKLLNRLEDYRQAVIDFEDTNNQLINIKTGEVTKTFTILAFLTFPLMLLSSLFSMNVRDVPLVDLPGGFWIILGIMIAGMIGMLVYFKKKKWL